MNMYDYYKTMITLGKLLIIKKKININNLTHIILIIAYFNRKTLCVSQDQTQILADLYYIS